MKQQDEKWVCNWHYAGVPAKFGPSSFFEERCWKCRDKRDKGIVKGDEPSPTVLARAQHRRQLSETGRAAVLKLRAIRSGRYCDYWSDDQLEVKG